MSVRIHQLSKQIGMENKDLIEILRKRGHEVKSASSTIDNISAEALVEEFLNKNKIDNDDAELKKNIKDAGSTKDMIKDSDISSLNERIVKTRDEIKNIQEPIKNDNVSPVDKKTISANQDTREDVTIEGNGTNSGTKIIHAKPPLVVRDFALQIELKPFKLISELMEMGIFASMNQTIEESVAIELAKRHGFILEIHHRGEGSSEKSIKVEKPKLNEDDPKLLKPRAPVCCILGHVDHGKTTLLDALRKTNIVQSEAGGITQHIGAYQIKHNDSFITFVDTPGHAAFSQMRSRGTNITDISILVIAADDGFKPQTDEALKLAQASNNSIIVAINKIDSKGANVDKVKQQMQEKGIASEDWGGETVTVEISALNGTNIEDLLDMILLQAEMLELKSNPSANPAGTIIESQIEQGRGAVASVIIEKGTLKKGDALISGESICRVKSMLDSEGNIVSSAGPSVPVKILGWSSVPCSGDSFSKEKNEKTAKRAADLLKSSRKLEESKIGVEEKNSGSGSSVADLFAAIENQQKKCLKVIVKSDVHGSLEALVDGLNSIKTDKVDLEIISKSVGNISKTDITMASAGEASIVGFNVRLDNGVQSFAKHENIQIIQNPIIYELLDQVKESMIDLLDSELVDKKSGSAEVRKIFAISKSRSVAGSMVIEGTIHRTGKAKLLRNNKIIFEGPIESLRRVKDDVKEVRKGFDCGINIKGCNDYQEGDILECYQTEKIKPSL